MEDELDEQAIREMLVNAGRYHTHVSELMTAVAAVFVWGQSLGLRLEDEPLATLHGPYVVIQEWKKGHNAKPRS